MIMIDVRKLDLNLLVVLEAIHGAGGVSRAAERLNLTQPAISHALARLRGHFGDPLFVRQGRSLVPTPLTRGLIEPLRRSLGELGLLLGETPPFAPATATARLTLAMRDPVELLLLPRLMPMLAREAPGIDLRVVQVARRNLPSALAAGTLDLALDVALPAADGVERQRIAADDLVVVVRAGHPRIRKGFDLDDYLREQHVMVTSRRKGPGFEDLVLGEHGLQRHVRLRCRNHLAAWRVVSESDLVLTMAARYVGVLDLGTGNRVLPLPVATPTFELYLYWHETADNAPANRWLRGLVQQSFASYSRGAMKSGQMPLSAARARTSRPRQKPSSMRRVR
jgi:DNA-binding transcriptional LysR family regulator